MRFFKKISSREKRTKKETALAFRPAQSLNRARSTLGLSPAAPAQHGQPEGAKATKAKDDDFIRGQAVFLTGIAILIVDVTVFLVREPAALIRGAVLFIDQVALIAVGTVRLISKAAPLVRKIVLLTDKTILLMRKTARLMRKSGSLVRKLAKIAAAWPGNVFKADKLCVYG